MYRENSAFLLNLRPDMKTIPRELMIDMTPSKSQGGFVYIMRNPSMPHIVKIGFTTIDPHQRAKDLSSHTGVPTPFRVVKHFRRNGLKRSRRMFTRG